MMTMMQQDPAEVPLSCFCVVESVATRRTLQHDNKRGKLVDTWEPVVHPADSLCESLSIDQQQRGSRRRRGRSFSSR